MLLRYLECRQMTVAISLDQSITDRQIGTITMMMTMMIAGGVQAMMIGILIGVIGIVVIQIGIQTGDFSCAFVYRENI